MIISDFIKQGEEIKARISGIKLAKVDEYNIWVETVLRFLNKTVPGDISIDRFQKQVNCFDPGYCNKREFERILSVLKSVEAMPSITIDTSAQAKKTDKGIEINNTLSQNQKQHQEQNQKQEQDIIVDILLESVKDELTGKQRKELLAIAKAAKDLKEAHKGILEKLKEYGENVSASIVANILTNPDVMTTLGSLL